MFSWITQRRHVGSAPSDANDQVAAKRTVSTLIQSCTDVAKRVIWPATTQSGNPTESDAIVKSNASMGTPTEVSTPAAEEGASPRVADLSPPEEVPIPKVSTVDDEVVLQNAFKHIKTYLEVEVRHLLGVYNRKPLRKFQENVQRCAYIRLKQTIELMSREQAIQMYATLTQPIRGFKTDEHAIGEWFQKVQACETIELTEIASLLAHVSAVCYGRAARGAHKQMTHEEKVAHYYNRLEEDIIREGESTVPREEQSMFFDNAYITIKYHFDAIPQHDVTNFFTRALQGTNTVKKDLHAFVMHYVHSSLTELSVAEPILKNPQLLDLLQAGSIQPEVWITFCLSTRKPALARSNRGNVADNKSDRGDGPPDTLHTEPKPNGDGVDAGAAPATNNDGDAKMADGDAKTADADVDADTKEAKTPIAETIVPAEENGSPILSFEGTSVSPGDENKMVSQIPEEVADDTCINPGLGA